LTDAEYNEGLTGAGFTSIDLEVTRRYNLSDMGDSLTGWANELDEELKARIVERFAGTFVHATKPL
jgi:hypothetical protein